MKVLLKLPAKIIAQLDDIEVLYITYSLVPKHDQHRKAISLVLQQQYVKLYDKEN